ncbi:4'-phosphopantetheinyl transferase superfamily protein [Methylopila sp. 73B]|uniref:4'-phosphopantetheinyl transferase family protein n=1 Tax=Methylopila sp. 73B TaxID=1120792 RepID=UPI0012DCECF2|nr:4'-phosphopantetheinyl transferase superfamily protein [Methylopila sp. 73B]
MDDGERRRAEALRAPGSRRLHALARALVRMTLSSYCDVAPDRWSFAPGPGGKPRIAGPHDLRSLRFNLSHTDGLLALAVSRDCDVGVDVERLDPLADFEGLAEVAFAPCERDAVRAAATEQRAARFFRLWTAKEALLKAQGLGLGTVDPRAIIFDAEASPPRLARPGGAGPWSFRALRPTAAHVATLAVPAASVELQVGWATPGRRVTPPSGSRPLPGLSGRTPSRRAS